MGRSRDGVGWGMKREGKGWLRTTSSFTSQVHMPDACSAVSFAMNKTMLGKNVF